MNIRDAVLQDLPAVQALIQASFADELRPYMTATQAGAASFLSVFVGHPHLYPERTYLVAEAEDVGLLGYAEYRLLEGQTGFLSYICVSPSARGQGVATRLMHRYLDLHPGVQRMQLDVFAQNAPALRLYCKLGFQADAETVWLRSPILPASPLAVPADLRLENLPAALAMHERYGFCELQGTFRGAPFKVGRIGAHVLRCFHAQNFSDTDFQCAMQSVLPELQEALLITSAASQPVQAVGQEINRSIRMTWHVPDHLRGNP